MKKQEKTNNSCDSTKSRQKRNTTTANTAGAHMSHGGTQPMASTIPQCGKLNHFNSVCRGHNRQVSKGTEQFMTHAIKVRTKRSPTLSIS